MNVCPSDSEFLYRDAPSPREVVFFNFSFHVIGLLGFINSLSLTNVFSFLAHITGLISEQLLRAAVGGSVLIPCSLPGYPLSLNWFYWQEGDNPVFRWENGKEMKIEDNKYEGRFQVFTHEFSAGNISIRLENISLEDDQKTFFSYVKFYDEEKKVFKQSEERCRSRLQVSGNFRSFFTSNLNKSAVPALSNLVP